jgi:hypothetical protein
MPKREGSKMFNEVLDSLKNTRWLQEVLEKLKKIPKSTRKV